jgi:glycosyltransferase involved in cell wall biosynthesis
MALKLAAGRLSCGVPPAILHIDTERGWRGGERQALWLARELERRGWRSLIAARTGEPLEARAAADGLRVVNCDPATEIDPRAVWTIRRTMRRERIEIVHAHTAHAVALGALATLGTRTPLVVARRVDFPLRRNAGTRWKYGRAAAIIAVSQAVGRVLERSGIDASRIDVVPDGTDVHRRIAPANDATLASLGLTRTRPLVVQVSQLVGHKDPVNFVGAMACAREMVPNVQGLIVGDGPMRPDVESAVHSLDCAMSCASWDIAKTQTRCSRLPMSSVSAHAKREWARCFSTLSCSAGLLRPRAPAGFPKSSSMVKTGLLAEVRDQRALGDAIARLLRDAPLRSRMSAAAQRRAADFSVEQMTDRTIAVYERVLAPPAGDAARSRTARSKTVSSSSPI